MKDRKSRRNRVITQSRKYTYKIHLSVDYTKVSKKNR